MLHFAVITGPLIAQLHAQADERTLQTARMEREQREAKQLAEMFRLSHYTLRGLNPNCGNCGAPRFPSDNVCSYCLTAQ